MDSNKQTEKSAEGLSKAALAYERFLRDNPAEREAMEAWGSAPLADDVKHLGTPSVGPQ